MLSSPDRDPFDWLTIPDILDDLNVPMQDWQEWEAAGQIPSGVIFPDGQVRISQLAYSRWLDTLQSDDTPITDPEEIRNAIRYALKMAGERGMSHNELHALFCQHITETAIDDALTALVRAGQCITATAGDRSTARYRHWGPG
ncbi:hypothetical protein [Streptosporangium subroseum]|uniref:hypothetical protein n=1 Tax=Streptosporangium subroseum TaxID=106412 RepID=UPI0030912A32|nr:hypothetical protein OHB15_47790 [Streptosporangium subroseum]